MRRSASRGLVPFLMPARQRWRAEDAAGVLERLESSGLSVREFAARKGLNALRLHRWRARLGHRGPGATSFVEIKAAAAAIEVVMRSGHIVRVHDGLADDTLRRLLALLDGGGREPASTSPRRRWVAPSRRASTRSRRSRR